MKHHFVPQFYLRGFTDVNVPAQYAPYVWIADFAQGKVTRRAPYNAAEITDYYAVDTAANSEPQFVEQLLSRVESECAPVHRDISEGRWPCTGAERERMARFLAIQIVRVPTFRDSVTDYLTNIGEVVLGMLAADESAFRAHAKASSPEMSDDEISRLYEGVLDGQFLASGNPVASLGHGLHVAENTLLPMLLNMHWALLKSDGAPPFITSDRPAFWVNPKAVGPFGRGLRAHDAELHFPIAPHVALLATWGDSDGVHIVGKDQVRRLNWFTAQMAETYAFASTEHEAQMALQDRKPAGGPPDA